MDQPAQFLLPILQAVWTDILAAPSLMIDLHFDSNTPYDYKTSGGLLFFLFHKLFQHVCCHVPMADLRFDSGVLLQL